MFVFMDESGTAAIPGLQEYFAVSAIAFSTEESRDKAESAMKELRGELDRKATFEFRFSELSPAFRMRFFEKVAGLDFKHFSCLLWKNGLGGQWGDECYVYERVFREVVQGLTPYLRELEAAQEKPMRVRVVHDEYTNPAYSLILAEEFGKVHRRDGHKMVPRQNIKQGKSKSSSLIQLADMCCGAVRWESAEHRKYLTAKSLGVCNLP